MASTIGGVNIPYDNVVLRTITYLGAKGRGYPTIISSVGGLRFSKQT